MITFITALYPEARELISRLQLKQQITETRYRLFEGEHHRVIITGTGMISAATAAARHFALYPAEHRHDLVINLGVAGYAPGKNPSGHQASPGDLFLASCLTEQVTGRTFYPDLLYRHPFRLLPAVTTPVVCTDSSVFSEETLIDMEASALYQALLPHIAPDRMLFFKVISDIPGQTEASAIHPETLLAPHITEILSYAERLQHFLMSISFKEPTLSENLSTLVERIKKQVPMTESMENEFERLITYALLSGNSLARPLQKFLATLPETPVRGKKQAMPHLNRLRDLILNEAENTLESASITIQDTSLFQSPFTTVYVEKEVWNTDWNTYFSSEPIFINHYKDIFKRSHQDFAAQKKAPALILAKKTGTLIYKGAPVCQSFGNEHFYYTSCMMNCIYNCDYCYLQGMYPSGHVVVFVNLDDYFLELKELLSEHPVYLCVSYDTDLLALEQRFGFVSRWLSFAAEHPTLTLEIRTKSGNPAVFEPLASLFAGKEYLKQQIIFAWTLSPEQLCKSTELGAASLPLRLKALQAAKASGFSVRLCFDPMIFHADWERNYSTLVDTVFSTISADCLYDVSIGVFRISADYLKNMRKTRPDNAIVQYPYITENGVAHYGTLSEKMVQYLKELLSAYLPAEKIFVWNGEN